MELKVNKEKCIGCGLCANLCPDVFKMVEAKSKVKDEVNLEEHQSCIEEAVNGCPTSAIEFNK